VVAEDDCTTAVTMVPVAKPMTRLSDTVLRTFLILFPATICRPSVMNFMPRMKMPSPPRV